MNYCTQVLLPMTEAVRMSALVLGIEASLEVLKTVIP